MVFIEAWIFDDSLFQQSLLICSLRGRLSYQRTTLGLVENVIWIVFVDFVLLDQIVRAVQQ